LAHHLFDLYVLSVDSVLGDAWKAALGLVGLAATIGLLRRQERIDAELMGQYYVRELRKRLFARILTSQPRVLGKQRRGLILMRFVGDLNAIRQWVSLGLARVGVALVSLTVVIVALAWMHWGFALVATVGVAGTAGLMWWQGGRLQLAINESRRRQAYLAANMTEKISHASVVQLFDQVEREQRYLARQNRRVIAAARIKAARMGDLRTMLEFGSGLVFVGTLMFAAFAVREGSASPGVFVAVFSLVGFLAAPMRDMGRAHEYWLSYRVAVNKLRGLAGRLRRLRQSSKISKKRISRGRIEFRDLTVGEALHQVSAKIEPGQRIALVGANGSGKSTLLSALTRMVEVDSGKVLLDGIQLKKLPLAHLREAVAFVGSDVPLIRGSLLKNLTYGLQEISQTRLQQVLHDCGVEPIVQRLPERLQTRITEGGANLSQGERARICLARALLRRPKILLLDEAEAHLDVPTTAAISRVIEQFPGTVLMATHRRDTARKADQVWHLHKGYLIAQGTPEDLLGSAGPTRQMFGAGLRLVS